MTASFRLYDTASGSKRPLRAPDGSPLLVYSCGVTPYDVAHLGHAVTALRCDTLRRYLVASGRDVRFVQNVTDVEDKVIARAAAAGEEPLALAARFAAAYRHDMTALGVAPPDAEPAVSEHIEDIVRYVTDLVKQGHAYVSSSGNVYFDVVAYGRYGALSGRTLEEAEDGTREAVRDDKRAAADFALWKRAEGPCTFPSPWGSGRPGWHIECSVLAHVHLGRTLDVHCGGLDLLFPHHENECAQSESHNGCPFVGHWFHTGLLTVDGTKMSKSLGNFVTVADAVSRYGAPLVRFVVQKFHYRSPVNFSPAVFRESVNHILELYRTLELLESAGPGDDPADDRAAAFEAAFRSAMDDDLGTPGAVVAVTKALRDARDRRRKGDYSGGPALARSVRTLGRVVGLFAEGETFASVAADCLRLRSEEAGLPLLSPADVAAAAAERADARSRKDYAAADAVRGRLSPYGVTLMDGDELVWRFEPAAGVNRK